MILTYITESSVASGHMFLVTPTDGAAVDLNTFAKLNGIAAIGSHVTRIINHT